MQVELFRFDYIGNDCNDKRSLGKYEVPDDNKLDSVNDVKKFLPTIGFIGIDNPLVEVDLDDEFAIYIELRNDEGDIIEGYALEIIPED